MKYSPLVKNLRKHLGKDKDWKEIYQNLKITKKHSESKDLWFDLTANNLAGAFLWMDTPQGFKYWNKIDDRFLNRALLD